MNEKRMNKTKEYKKEKKWNHRDIIGYEKDDDPEYMEFVYSEIVCMTDKAALLKIDGNKVWIPRSQIIDATEDTIYITPWIAEKVGLH